MKRKIRCCIIYFLAIILQLMSSMPIYAKTMPAVRTIDSMNEDRSDQTSRIQGTPRGMLISFVEATITDKGNGTVGVYGGIFCHEPMQEIKMNLYLQIWDANDEMWTTAKRYSFEWNTDDNPEEDLTVGAVAFDVDGLERGRDYRLRIIAGAYDLDSGYSEAWRAETSAIQVQ